MIDFGECIILHLFVVCLSVCPCVWKIQNLTEECDTQPRVIKIIIWKINC